ncbi:MAG: hypothetical protein GEV04_06010 [Actinophytocola sp.]|nr:hypothetical protein [Actinophytocola sp.]
MADFVLRPANNQAELQDRVNKLDAELPKLGVQNLLDQVNRTGVSSTSPTTCNPTATKGFEHVGRSFCFDAGDSSRVGATVEWMPQGVTTVADAQSDQLWGTKRAILISWYDKAPEDGGQSGGDADKIKGVRITFFDPDTAKYQHVLLAYPYINSYGNPTYMSLRTKQIGSCPELHAGGISWYGNYLYVADTNRGFRVFDMRYIFDLKTASNGDTSDKYRIGRHSGVYYGHGYRYVMPQVAAYVNPNTPPGTCYGGGSPKFSFTGLDRSGTDHLTSGEYSRDTYGRVARWPLAGTTGKPKLTDGLWRATSAYRLPVTSVQGAVSHNGTWYLSRSRGVDNLGRLYVAEAPGTSTGSLSITETHYGGVGVEDLSHWPNTAGGVDEFWTVTEHPGKRLLYACDPIGMATTGTICGTSA